MEKGNLDLTIEKLGECRIPSPLNGEKYVDDDEHVLYHSNLNDIKKLLKAKKPVPVFELAGPRKKVFFDPSKLKCGIVTCGGICPGLDDVTRAITLGLRYNYGVKHVFGFHYGYEGLSPRYGHPLIDLTHEVVGNIHKQGGTILGSSRGPQDISEIVDTLECMNIGILFTIGGDGTLRGAQAISEEIERRNLKIAVIGVPKTIDNDISYVERSFGFETAISEAQRAIYAAHIEAKGARNGIGLVKLMGRDSGWIAAYAALVSGDVNFCLIPEERFGLEPFLEALGKRLDERRHAVIAAAEGAGQDMFTKTGECDASGNVRYGDIGVYLRDRIKAHFKKIGREDLPQVHRPELPHQERARHRARLGVLPPARPERRARRHVGKDEHGCRILEGGLHARAHLLGGVEEEAHRPGREAVELRARGDGTTQRYELAISRRPHEGP